MPLADRTLTLLPTAVHAGREVAARLEAAAGAAGGGAALPGLAVLTLSVFEQRLSAEVLGPGGRASELTARLLVRKVLREAYPDGADGYFAPLRHSPGFADHLRDLFGRFARGLVTPVQLAALDAARLGGRLAQKVRELARLYAACETHLDRLGRGDPAARRRSLVAALSALETPPRLLHGLERIVAADRDRWLPSDAELLAKVARFVPVEVHLHAPLPGRERVLALVDRSADALRDAARRTRAPLAVTRDRPCGGPDTAAPLAELCARLFRPAGDAAGRAPLDTGETLRVVEAPGREEEAAAVVREVRRALEAGTPPERIAVVARDLDRYDRLLAAALERARVPYHFRRGTPLLGTPLVRAALALLALPARRFDLDGLLGVFGGGYTGLAGAWRAGPPSRRPGAALGRGRADPAGARPAGAPRHRSHRAFGGGDTRPGGVRPERLERVLNEAGLLEGPPAAWAAALDALAAALEAEGKRWEAAGCRAVRAALVPALEAVAALDREASLAGHVSRVEGLLARSGLAGRAASGDDRRRRQDAAALAGLREALAALRLAEAELGEPVRLTLEAFRELLVAAVAERFVAPPGSRPAEAVEVLAAADLAGLRFDLVCLLGLVEGELPRRAPADPILSEREVEALALALAPHGPFETPAQARAAEPFYFFRALCAARARLVLSVPAEDERGRPLLASSLLEEVARAVDPEARVRHPQGDPLAALRAAPIHLPADRRPVPGRFADCLTVAEAEARLAWLAPGRRPAAVARRREAAAEGIDPAAIEAALSADPGVAARLEARRAMARLAAARDRFFAEPPGAARAALAGPGTGALGSEAARVLLRAALAPSGEVRLSASALEAHAQCPYQWFLRYGVRLEPLDRPRRDLGADQTGDLLHRALERGYRACARAGLVPIGGPCDPEGRAACALMLAKAEEVLAGWAGSLRPGVPAPVRAAEAEQVRRLARAFVGDEAARAGEGFVPVAFEHGFGLPPDGDAPSDAGPGAGGRDGGSRPGGGAGDSRPGGGAGDSRPGGGAGDAPPLRVPLAGGLTAVLHGRVDRIDAAPGRLRVVDYKRASSSRAKAYEALLAPEALGVRSFQVPVYLLAAEALRRARPELFPPARPGACGEWGAGAPGCAARGRGAGAPGAPGAHEGQAPAGASPEVLVPRAVPGGAAAAPGASTPGPAAGGHAAPGAAAPDAVASNDAAPGAALAVPPPGGVAPGAGAPGTTAPGAATPGAPALGTVALEAAFHLLKRRPDLRRRPLDDPGYLALDPETRAARRAAGLPTFADQLEARVRRALAGPYEITPDPDCGFCPYGAVCRVVTPPPAALP